MKIKGDKVSIDKQNIDEDNTREYVFDWDENPAKNFFIVEADLKRIASDREVAPQEVIQEFISDLENRDNPDYEVKINEIKINGVVSKKFILDAKKYFSRVIEVLEKARKKEAKKEKNSAGKQEIESIWASVLEFIEANKDLTLREVLVQIKEKSIFPELKSAQRKAIIKRTETLIQEEEKKEAMKEAKKEKAWQSICLIVDRECSRPDLTDREYLKNVVMYWNAIKDKVISPESADKNVLKISDSIKEDILGLINAEIYANKEELYYKEVEHFTKGFSFLATDLEFQEAVSGKSGRKFIDLESYNRFYDLRAKLQKVGGEYNQICKLLKKDNIDETSKKILTERKMVMEAEKAKKAAEFVGDSAR